MAALTEKQERFALKDFECGNGVEAYRYAYPTSEKWSDNAVAVQASRMRSNPKIVLRMQELRESQQKVTQINADYVLNKAVSLLNADLSELFGDDGEIKPINEWPKELMPIVGGIEVTETKMGDDVLTRQVTKIKLSERTKLLDMVAKHRAVDAYVRPNRGTADEPIHQKLDVSAPEVAKAVSEVMGKL